MEIKAVDFFLGLAAGAALVAGVGLAVGRIRAWLGYSEAGRQQKEIRDLKRRLAEKDHHISRMLTETERLAQRLAERMAGKKE